MRRVVATAVLVLLTGCAGSAPETAASSEDPETSESQRTETPSSKSPKPRPSERAGSRGAGTRITVSPSDFGPMLFDGDGQAIYLFDTETSDKPKCYDACAEAWPPVLSEGDPVATGAARDGLLGTTRRTDGSVQVTYGGHPLYFYAHEEPGQVLCHDVEGFGGLWLVVTPGGDAAPH